MGRGWLLLAVALLSAGCYPAPQKVTEPVYEEAPWPQPPAIFEVKTDQVEIGLDIDPATRRYPALYERLRDDGVSRLQAFAEEMTAYRLENGVTGMAPYTMGISWARGGETGRLASFEGYEGQYAGGAHPDGHASSILWDRTAQREIDRNLIFRPDAAEALDARLCAALNAEKHRRGPYGYLAFLHKGDTHGYACLKAREIPFVLEPAATGDRAAGVLFLLGPYVGGAYSEGAFRIFVPTAALRPLLADEYADQFSENPRRP